MTRLETLMRLIAAFEKTQAKFAKAGAQDTEPDGIFQRLLVKALAGKKVYVPSSPDGWELYSETRRATEAAAALHNAAQDCIKCIQESTIANSEEIRQYLTDYCWRC